MRAMPRKDTRVEIALRRELHRLGLRFRVNHRGLPGTPDIAFTRARIAVFVDGCFWHRCPEHGTSPKNNASWWAEKLAGNVERDRKKDRDLAVMGWTVVHVWEHEDPVQAAVRIRQMWMARLGSIGGSNAV
ncbi:very short patch repair endonuclease [Mycolicibacterium thermoresistibile]